MVSVIITLIPVPTSLVANVPDCNKVTVSLLTTPLKVPPVIAADKVPSYTLLGAVVPVTVNVLGVTVMVPGVA